MAKLQVKVDDGTPRDVLASMSDVVVDASSSTGTGALTFSIDFGDGTVATSATAHHTYATVGSFTIAATVTDAEGRKATDSSAITVKAIAGRWFQAGFVTRSNRVEVRQLSIDSQNGLTVRGLYRATGAPDRTFTGTLTPPRKIEIAMSGAGLLGLLPDRLNDEATLWTLIAQGDSVDGERLDFHAIVGDPVDAPPKADLKLKFDGIDYYDGSGQMPIIGLTPVLFDGTGSRGSGLTSFIEFGDGTAAVAAQVTRPVETWGTARLTVIDRYGRSDAASSLFYTFELLVGPFGNYWSVGDRLSLNFQSRNGVNYSGKMWSYCCQRSVPTSATLSGIRDIRITVPDTGVTYQGRIERDRSLTLTQIGGADNGKVWKLSYHSPDY